MIRFRLFRNLRKAHQQWRQDDGNLMAAAVAYYSALAFFPLLLVVISVFGLVLQWTAWGSDAEAEVLSAIGDYASPAVQDNVREILDQVQRKAVIGGPLGIGLLIFAAVALFTHFEHAFDRIWNVDRGPVEGILHAVRRIAHYRLRAFLMLMFLFVLLLIVFLAGVAFSSVKAYTKDSLPAADWVWWSVETGFSVVLNWGLFTLMYGVLPKVSVRWSEAARGGLLAALIWDGGRHLLTAFLVSKKYSAYGIVGSFLALMLWAYFACVVVFLGAEYVQVICKNCNNRRTPDDVEEGEDKRGENEPRNS